MKLALLFLSFGAYSGAALAFLTQVLLARLLSLEEFGAFAAALSLVTLIAPLAGFGVGIFWLRAFGEEGLQALRWINPSVKFTLVSTVVVLVVIFLWALLAPHSGLNKSLLFILSSFVVGQVAIELSSSIYQLEEKYASLALWQFLPHFLRFGMLLMVWFFIESPLSAINVSFVYFVTAMIMLIVGCRLILKIYRGDLNLVGHKPSTNELGFRCQVYIKDVIHESWPFGLAGFFYLIYFQSSIVVLGYILGNESAAIYSVVITIMTAIYLFPSVVYQKLLLPKIHRWANQDKKMLLNVYSKGNFVMLFLGAFIAVMLFFLAPYLILIVFGEEYVGAIPILSVLAFSIPIRFIATSVGSVLTSNDNMIRKVKYMGVVATINIFISIFLIKYIGIVGAAYSIVLSDSLLLAFYYYTANKFVLKSV